LKNTTITIWVSPKTEIDFLQYLKIISDLPFESNYTWKVKDVEVSKAMISDWVWVNLDIETYLKFLSSFRYNGGTFY